MEQQLYAVPPLGPFEAPSSWLRRLALSQGVSVWEIGRFLGFRMNKDCDLQMATMDLAHLTRVTGVAEEIFEGTRRILAQAVTLKMKIPVLLSEDGLPRYRFCVECLKGMRTPYLPIAWRVDVWRLCPTHQCMMEDHCPHCGATVCPQAKSASAGKALADVSMGSQCLVCSKFLWDMQALNIKKLQHIRISKSDRTRLMNGRAFVSALYQGTTDFPGLGVIGVQEAVERGDRLGFYATETSLTADGIRRDIAFAEDIANRRRIRAEARKSSLSRNELP